MNAKGVVLSQGLTQESQEFQWPQLKWWQRTCRGLVELTQLENPLTFPHRTLYLAYHLRLTSVAISRTFGGVGVQVEVEVEVEAPLSPASHAAIINFLIATAEG